MSEKTKEVKKYQDTMYTRSLHSETNMNIGTIWPMDLVFMSTFDNQSMSIGCIGKLGHLFGFLRHYLLKVERTSFTRFPFHLYMFLKKKPNYYHPSQFANTKSYVYCCMLQCIFLSVHEPSMDRN